MLKDENRVIEVVRQALIDHAEGDTTAPLPGLLESADPPGDCHVKFAQSAKHGLIVVKVATGFYDNGRTGLPVNDGLITIFSAVTGQAIGVIDDAGLVTSSRTAAMGVIAARLGHQDRKQTVGIVGTGHQAQLQAAWASRHVTDQPIRIFGRNKSKAEALAADLAAKCIECRIHDHIGDLAENSDTIILCTNSSKPILKERDIRPTHHIVSLGADGPGKSELSPGVYRRCGSVAGDDLDQVVRRSDFAAAVRRGFISRGSVTHLGRHLKSSPVPPLPPGPSLVNLCGTAACDLAIVADILRRGTMQPAFD